MKAFWKNILTLAFCQAMMLSAMSLMLTTSALIGLSLASDKSLATLPLAIQFLSISIATIPAAILMKHIGRKYGFMIGTLFAISGTIVATYAIYMANFWLFVAGSSLLGISNGFGNYYRFTAADAVTTEYKSRAISYVLAGGVVAAFIGPNMAIISRNWVPSAPYAGSYASLIIFYTLTLIALNLLKLPKTSKRKENTIPGRPLILIIKQPKFIVALICGMFSYGVMSLIMTATPLAMHHHAHQFGDTSFVIQWHVLGMFVPSFFTGNLIRRYGTLNIMLAGVVAMIICIATNLSGTSVTHFWIALFLLGIGWNFLFVGATTLLTETYHPEELTKIQSFNDFSVFSIVTISMLTAGTLQHLYGWRAVNYGVIPFIILILTGILWLKIKNNSQTIIVPN